jgi:hypothetical protein
MNAYNYMLAVMMLQCRSAEGWSRESMQAKTDEEEWQMEHVLVHKLMFPAPERHIQRIPTQPSHTRSS